MMATVIEQAEQAIKQGNRKQARELLHEELASNPTAEAYYLASLVALDADQQRDFLEKALAIYPFHKKASLLMKRIETDPARAAARPAESPSALVLPLASISKRFVAIAIDSILVAVTALSVFSMLDRLQVLPPITVSYVISGTTRLYEVVNPSYLLASFINGAIISALYYAYYLTQRDGQTPGKRLRGIKVVSLNGGKITFRQALIRNVIGYWLSSLILIGYFWAMWDPNRQAWHDKLAKTIVVKTS